MKIKYQDIAEKSPVQDLLPNKIDLNAISSIINALNNIMAPVVSKDINNIKLDLDKRNEASKTKLLEVKELTKKNSELKVEKQMVLKRIKIVSMLGEMFSSYAINDKIKKDMLSMMATLDAYDDKRLDAQISKLERIMAK